MGLICTITVPLQCRRNIDRSVFLCICKDYCCVYSSKLSKQKTFVIFGNHENFFTNIQSHEARMNNRQFYFMKVLSRNIYFGAEFKKSRKFLPQKFGAMRHSKFRCKQLTYCKRLPGQLYCCKGSYKLTPGRLARLTTIIGGLLQKHFLSDYLRPPTYVLLLLSNRTVRT